MGRQVDEMRRSIQNSQEVDSLCFNSMTHMNPLWLPLMGILLEKLTVSQIVNNIASRNHGVHYRAHKNRPLLPVRNKMPEVLTSHPVSEIILLILSSHLWVGRLSILLSYSDFLAKMCVRRHLVTLFIIILTQFGKEYKLWIPVRIQWRECNKVVTPPIIFWLAVLGSIFQYIER